MLFLFILNIVIKNLDDRTSHVKILRQKFMAYKIILKTHDIARYHIRNVSGKLLLFEF